MRRAAQITPEDRSLEAVRESLLRRLYRGQTIYTNLRHCSRSGMRREVSLLVVDVDSLLVDITFPACRVMGWRSGKHDGAVIGGCGMDMGFALVYELSQMLCGDGYALKQQWIN